MDISNPEFDPIKTFQEFRKWVEDDEIFYRFYCSEGIEILICDWLYASFDYDNIVSSRLLDDGKLLLNIWLMSNLIYQTSKHSSVYYLFKE